MPSPKRAAATTDYVPAGADPEAVCQAFPNSDPPLLAREIKTIAIARFEPVEGTRNQTEKVWLDLEEIDEEDQQLLNPYEITYGRIGRVFGRGRYWIQATLRKGGIAPGGHQFTADGPALEDPNLPGGGGGDPNDPNGAMMEDPNGGGRMSGQFPMRGMMHEPAPAPAPAATDPFASLVNAIDVVAKLNSAMRPPEPARSPASGDEEHKIAYWRNEAMRLQTQLTQQTQDADERYSTLRRSKNAEIEELEGKLRKAKDAGGTDNDALRTEVIALREQVAAKDIEIARLQARPSDGGGGGGDDQSQQLLGFVMTQAPALLDMAKDWIQRGRASAPPAQVSAPVANVVGAAQGSIPRVRI